VDCILICVVCCALCSGTYVIYQRGDINRPIVMFREWKNNDFNFDDVAKGMLTLFTVATFEGWPGLVTYIRLYSPIMVAKLLADINKLNH